MNDRRNIMQHIGRTPLVALGRIARDLPVPVLVKCEHLNPGGSTKDRIALAIVEDAEARGALRPGMTLIEATAGNTGPLRVMMKEIPGLPYNTIGTGLAYIMLTLSTWTVLRFVDKRPFH